ncbi:MAG: hypothetical protein R6U17_07890 [Thermoplasmata archaeon]
MSFSGAKMAALVIGLIIMLSHGGAANYLGEVDGDPISIYEGVRDIEIYDWYDLDNIRNDLSGNYVLMNDLDEYSPGYSELAGPSANAGAGWDPLGEYVDGTNDIHFTGSFDGQGYRIKDLYINRPEAQVVGLFEITGEGAEIRNLGLIDVDITGADGAGALVGVSREDTWIETCYVEGGSVQGVSSEDFSVGGLIAQNSGMIKDCYTYVTVTGENLLHIGGLVGLHIGFLKNSYAAGVVTGGGNIGGLVGTNGPIADFPSRGHVINSFSDSETTGVSNPIGVDDENAISENVAAYPTSTMQSYGTYEPYWDIATMGAWDGETWYIEDGVDYPRLYYQMPSFQLTINVEGSGTTDPSPGTHSYSWGDYVTITALPDPGQEFNNWLGDYPDSSNNEDKYNPEITVVVNGHMDITAKFIEEGRKRRVVESQRGWNNETDLHDGTCIFEDNLRLFRQMPGRKPDMAGADYTGWNQSEDEYQKEQAEWLRQVKERRKRKQQADENTRK